MASGFLTFYRALIKKLFWVVHAKSIANLCKLSRLYSHWIVRLYFCTPYPNLGKLTIIQWIWAKYRDLSVANRSIICQSRRLKQMIDLFYHWFDHRSCFLMNIFGKRSDLPFLRKSDHKKEKSVASFKHEQNINCSQTYPNTWAKPQRRLLSAHALTFLGFSYFSQNRQIWAAEIDHLNFEGADYPSTGRR